VLAEEVDTASGAPAAALVKEFRAALTEALSGAAVSADLVDELKARRSRRAGL
jgi:hypothetical protein